jgi:hypothetical protein
MLIANCVAHSRARPIIERMEMTPRVVIGRVATLLSS